MNNKEKLIIYQVFPRILTNNNPNCVPNGTYGQNGSGKLNEITDTVIDSIRALGVNCIWLTGVIEMATKTTFDGIPCDNPNVVKGEAGSPYAIKDYYDVAPSLAVNLEKRMAEFEALVERIHNKGMKVLLDFVPNHTARCYHSDSSPAGVHDFGKDDDISMFFSPLNNYYYITNQQFSPSFSLQAPGTDAFIEFPAKATGNDCFTAFCGENDWYETVKLNYGHDYGDHSDHFTPIPDTWLKMLNILRFWASKGVDGFRCDMVFMVPQAFWHWVIPQVRKDYPDIIFIGEIYDIALYRSFLDYCHFDYLYDKVNLYDTLVGIERNNVSAAQLTSCWQTVDGIGDSMLNFLENHDEVRFGNPAYSGNPARVIPSLVTGAMISKGPFMIYYGQELGESAKDNEGFAGDNSRTTIFDYWSYDTLRRWYNGGKCDGNLLTQQEKWLRNLYRKVLTLCNEEKAISEGEFFDLMYVNLQNPNFNPHRQFAFLRYTEDRILLVIVNFDEKAATLSVNIPDLAYSMTGLEQGEYQVKDLLWDKPMNFTVDADKISPLHVGGLDAVIIPITGKSKRKRKYTGEKPDSKGDRKD